jgi:hypothetical protein
MGVVELAGVKLRAGKARMPHFPQVGFDAPEARAVEAAFTQIGAFYLRVGEIGLPEVHLGGGNAVEPCAAEIGAGKVDVHQSRAVEVGGVEIGSAEVGAAYLHVREIHDLAPGPVPLGYAGAQQIDCFLVSHFPRRC